MEGEIIYMLIETIERKSLSRQDFINDILMEHWDKFSYQCDTENENRYVEYVLARGQFLFDSIKFDTEFGQAIYLFNKDNEKEQFLSIGGNNSARDNQIAFVEKETVFDKCTNSMSALYIVHFVETKQIIKFGAYREK